MLCGKWVVTTKGRKAALGFKVVQNVEKEGNKEVTKPFTFQVKQGEQEKGRFCSPRSPGTEGTAKLSSH